jgi:hypothetical protein
MNRLEFDEDGRPMVLGLQPGMVILPEEFEALGFRPQQPMECMNEDPARVWRNWVLGTPPSLEVSTENGVLICIGSSLSLTCQGQQLIGMRIEKFVDLFGPVSFVDLYWIADDGSELEEYLALDGQIQIPCRNRRAEGVTIFEPGGLLLD